MIDIDNIINHPIFTRGSILPQNSIHRLSHWQRVEKFGQMIADKNGADKFVVRLFAYLHDARRVTDHIDNDHGKRAAFLLDELVEESVLVLSDSQYGQLSYALSWHNLTYAESDDLTVRTCWDADRLDLWRAGIAPDPKLLYTEEARDAELLEYSRTVER